MKSRQSHELELRHEQALEAPILLTPAEARAAYTAGEEMVKDLQLALKMLQKYQRNLSMLGAPDPEIVDARALLRRYDMAYEGWALAFRVFLDGEDITEHPDSTLGSAEEIVDTELVAPDLPELEGGVDERRE